MSGGVIETLVATSLLMALVLVVRGPVARAFGARAAYALWLAPLARLLLPPVPVEADMPAMFVDTGAAAAAALEPAGGAIPATPLLLALWLGGSMLFLAWHLGRYHRFLARALRQARPIAVPQIVNAVVLESPAVSGPAATGLLARRIFVPVGFADRFPREERELALMHEALHHRRGDLWAGAVALLMLALHWFNPLAFAAHRAFRRDLEAACDSSLVDRFGAAVRPVYARAIMRCVAPPVPRPSCALTHLDDLKGRLEMLKLNHGVLRRTTGIAIAASLAAGGMFLVRPAAAQDRKQEIEKVERFTIIRKHGEDSATEIPAEVRARMADCKGETFETEAAVPADGKRRKTRIVLCGKPGATKAEMAAMLEKALGRLEGNDEMSADSKSEIVARLKARIAELRAAN